MLDPAAQFARLHLALKTGCAKRKASGQLLKTNSRAEKRQLWTKLRP
jgi:hypothetical protein